MADALLLNLVLLLPLAGVALLLPVSPAREDLMRGLSLAVMLVQFAVAAVLYVHFDAAVPGVQFETRLPWIPDWGVYYRIGLDGTNVLLVLLTAFLGPLVVAGAFSAIRKDVKTFYAMVFLIQFTMLGTFLAQDLFLFYLFWEAMMIPMFLIIGIWGGERRIYATLKFVLYTAFGSILMLAAVIYHSNRFELSEQFDLAIKPNERLWGSFWAQQPHWWRIKGEHRRRPAYAVRHGS